LVPVDAIAGGASGFILLDPKLGRGKPSSATPAHR